MPLKRLLWPLMGFGSVAAVWVAGMYPPGWEQAPYRPPGGRRSSIMPAFACTRSSCEFHECHCVDSSAPDEYPHELGYGRRPARRPRGHVGHPRSCETCCATRAPPPGQCEHAPAPASAAP